MFHRRPQALTQLSSGTSESLARLAALEGFSRALLVGVVPLPVSYTHLTLPTNREV